MIRFDTQAAFMGTASRIDSIRAAGRMSRFMDQRRPKRLTEEQKNQVYQDADIKEMVTQRDELSRRRRLHRKRKDILEATILSEKLKEVQSLLRSLVKTRHRELTKQIQAEWDSTAPIDDIRAQLEGRNEQKDSSTVTTDSIQYEFQERWRISEAILNPPSDSHEGDVSWQSEIIDQMVSLCSRAEGPFRKDRRKRNGRLKVTQTAEEERKKDSVSPTPEPILSGLQRHPLECLFCLGNTSMSLTERTHPLSSKWRLQEHTKSQHRFQPGEGCPFPHPDCANITLQSEELFRNHAATIHGIFM